MSNRSACFYNATPEEKERLNRSIRFYYGWVAFALAGIGLILCVLYIAAVIRSMLKNRVSKKCYILLLDRAVSDAMACVVALVIAVYVFSVNMISFDVMGVTEVLLIGSFWSAMVSYVSLSLLKLYAVARPLQYRHVITLRRCIYLIAISWTLYLLQIISILVVQALVKNDVLRLWSGCRTETCSREVHRIRHILILICYFITLVAFVLTVIYINRAQRYLENFRTANDKVLRFSLWKLASNVITFAVLYAFQVAYSSFVLYTYKSDKCIFVQRPVLMWTLQGIVRSMLLLRIMLDPIVSFFVDYQIRQSVIELIELICHKKIYLDQQHRVFPQIESHKEDDTDATTDGYRGESMTTQKNSSKNKKPNGKTDVNNSFVDVRL